MVKKRRCINLSGRMPGLQEDEGRAVPIPPIVTIAEATVDGPTRRCLSSGRVRDQCAKYFWHIAGQRHVLRGRK